MRDINKMIKITRFIHTVGVTVTCVDQCGAGACPGWWPLPRPRRHTTTPHPAVRAESSAVAATTPTSTVHLCRYCVDILCRYQYLDIYRETAPEPGPPSPPQLEMRSLSIHLGRALGSQQPVASHWNVSSPGE